MGNFVQELRRRNVVRVVGAYLVVSWLLVQIATTLEESMQLPAWFDGVVVGLLIVGLPIAIIVAWVFDLTPEGVVRTDAADDDTQYKPWRKLDYVIVAGIVIVAVVIGWQWLSPKQESAAVAETEQAPTAEESVSAATIAVLPFADLSPEGDQEYFSDGISEEILNLLAGIEELDVTSRTSAFQFKGRELGIPEIAANLEVRHVVEGSVRKAGSTLRITAQLIDAQDDRHLWSDTFDKPLTAENVFAIQDEIATAIVGALGETLGFDATDNIEVRIGTENLSAYEQFLKARSLYQGRVDLDVAENLLIAALEQDPEFAEAWETRAALQFLLNGYGYRNLQQAEIVRLTTDFANRALALNPESSTALASLAYVNVRSPEVLNGDEDFGFLLQQLTRAIEINPHNDSALNWRGLLLLTVGDVGGALDNFAACIEISPLTAPCGENYISVLAGAGRDEEAYAYILKMLNLGIFKPRETDIALVARMGEEVLFKMLTNSQEMLFGWNDHDSLYNAFRNPDGDHQRLIRSLNNFLERQPERGSLALPIALSYLGVRRGDLEVLTLWPQNEAHSAFRQTDEFRNFIRRSGILDYWLQNEFPPQCRTVGDGDFECD